METFFEKSGNELDGLVEGDFEYVDVKEDAVSSESENIEVKQEILTNTEASFDIRPAEEFIDAVSVEIDDSKRYCFGCSRLCKKIRTPWLECSIDGCSTSVCPQCQLCMNRIKKNSWCVVCARKYIAGSRRDFSPCSVCATWCCKICVASCRHIIRLRWSQHNFEL